MSVSHLDHDLDICYLYLHHYVVDGWLYPSDVLRCLWPIQWVVLGVVQGKPCTMSIEVSMTCYHVVACHYGIKVC